MTATATNALTIGTGLSGTSYNGSAPVTIALTNTAVTIGTTSVSLGGTALTLGGLTSVTVTQDPVAALDLATKQYVDTVAEGLHVHASCDAATPATLASITGGTVTYNNGTAGVGATLTLSVPLTILDGYTLLNTNRVLVKNEATQAHNGIYTWATGGTVLTRATDFDTAIEIASGDFTFISNGTLYADTGWVQTEPVTNIGSDPIIWNQFSGAGTYTAGTGLTLAGSQFSITNTGVSAATYGSASSVPTIAVNAQGQITSASNTSIAIDANQITSGTLPVANGGTGATTLTGYVKGSGTSAFTAASTIPTTDLSGTISNAQLANSAITINGTSTSLGGSINVGTVTSVSGAGTVNGLTLTGTVTASGNLTLGGTLDLSSPPAIGGTAPNAITGTTITATNYVGISGGTF